jgi:hypothetical protein
MRASTWIPCGETAVRASISIPYWPKLVPPAAERQIDSPEPVTR